MPAIDRGARGGRRVVLPPGPEPAPGSARGARGPQRQFPGQRPVAEHCLPVPLRQALEPLWRRKLYAVGGYDGASRQCLSTVEQYNPAANEWTYVADMSTCRSGAGVGVLSRQLYATGGHDGPLVRKSVEVYDPGTNTWKQVADMNMCRRDAGVCAVNGLLYVVGGDDGSCNLASVEYYIPATDKWTLLPTNMSMGRSYAGVAVIHKPL